jgi:hypothetical protein
MESKMPAKGRTDHIGSSVPSVAELSAAGHEEGARKKKLGAM